MDRTAWIVVSACVALLAFNFYWNKGDEAPAKEKPAAVTQQADPTSPTAPTAPTGDASKAATIATAGAAATDPSAEPTTKVIETAAATAKPVEIASLTSYDKDGKACVRYSFQDIGGSLSFAEMLDKPINSTKPDLQQNVHINEGTPNGIGTLLFGLSAENAPQFDTVKYALVEATKDKVVLLGKMKDINVRKTYSLKPIKVGDEVKEGLAYALSLEVMIVNTSAEERGASNWGIYAGVSAPISTSEGGHYSYYITYADDDFEKMDVGDFRPLIFGSDKDRILDNELENLTWAGTMNQYYASVIQAHDGSKSNMVYAAPIKVKLPVTGETEEGLELALAMPSFQLSPAANGTALPRVFNYDIFTGPKLNMMLGDINKEFKAIDSIMDYGWLALLSYPMNWLINIFHGWFGNWGWAIVAMTFVVRLCIWPLYRKSYMSMKRMSLLQPMMKELKEKHPDNPQKVNMEMMKLYKEYGISPLGGCLPMLLQIPIFFAFFYVLQTSAEFRGAPFIGWVTDLSQMDTVATLPIAGFNIPINVLPFVMVITMVIQMRMTPQAGDAMQQRIMKLMPLLFFVFCYTYPSALALYWTTQNIISIAQTWFIQRVPIPELTKVSGKKGGKKGFFERMVEAQQAALAEQQKRQKQQGGGNNMRNVTKK